MQHGREPFDLSLNFDSPLPPVAKVVPKEITAHGDTRVDNYFWLRDKSDPETIAYLEAENQYTEAVMAPPNRCRILCTRRFSGASRRPTFRFP